MGKACWQLEHWIVCPHKFWGNNTATRQCGQLYFLVWRGTINAVEQSVQKMVMPAPTSSTSKCFPQTVQTKCMEIMELPFSCLEFSNWPGNGQFESRKARGPVRPLPCAKPSEFFRRQTGPAGFQRPGVPARNQDPGGIPIETKLVFETILVHVSSVNARVQSHRRTIAGRVRIGMAWLAALAGTARDAGAQVAAAPTNLPPYECTTNSDRTLTIARYTGLGGAVTVPAAIAGRPVARIGDNAFDYCKTLTSVALPDSVATIDKRAFSYCSGLTSVALGKGLAAIGDQAFFYCWNLPRIDLPDGVVAIGDLAFESCASLAEIRFGPNVAAIGEEAFAYCSGLARVELPAGLATLGNNAFASCANLRSVTVPAATVRIGNRAFSGCSNLSGVYFLGRPPELGNQVFDQSERTVVYCPPDAPGWGKTFGGRPTAAWTPNLPAAPRAGAPTNSADARTKPVGASLPEQKKWWRESGSNR